MKCKICNSQNLSIYLDNPKILECNDCKNSFRLKAPLAIEKMYSFRIPMPDFFSTKLRNRHHIDLIERNIGFKNIQSILEIGSGNGKLIKRIRHEHHDVKITVIEPGSYFKKELSKIKNISIINDYIENVNINEKFDLIIMSHVLEHLEKPVENLIFIYEKFLKINGYLYIDIPNKDYELRNIHGAMIAPVIHLFFFAGIGIKNILMDIGFKEEFIFGNKYSTLPNRFIHSLELIANNDIRFLEKIKLKIINRFILFFSGFNRVVFKKKIIVIGLDESNSKFNNIAIIGKKC